MDITAEIITDFRNNYPQFSNVTTWTDAIVTQALCEGDSQTGSTRWGAYQDECHNTKQRGMFLYAAHLLTVYYPRGGDQTPSSDPSWAWNSKSLGDASVSYNTGSSDVSPGNAWLLGTLFGQQFYRIMRTVALGGFSV